MTLASDFWNLANAFDCVRTFSNQLQGAQILGGKEVINNRERGGKRSAALRKAGVRGLSRPPATGISATALQANGYPDSSMLLDSYILSRGGWTAKSATSMTHGGEKMNDLSGNELNRKARLYTDWTVRSFIKIKKFLAAKIAGEKSEDFFNKASKGDLRILAASCLHETSTANEESRSNNPGVPGARRCPGTCW